MKFVLVDKIESIEPGKKIITSKALTLAEEYLGDHFPIFPVMPGVLMLEALTQSAAWLTRVAQNFSKSVIVLATAKNVRYANFVQPGNIMRCEVEAIEIGPDSAKFKGTGMVGDKTTVSARLELRCFNVIDRYPYMTGTDAAIIEQLKTRFRISGGPEALAAAGL